MSNGRLIAVAVAMVAALGLSVILITRTSNGSHSLNRMASTTAEADDQHTVLDYLAWEDYAPLEGRDSMPVVEIASLSVNSSNDLLVADRGDFNIKIFDIRSGELTAVLGDRGAGDGEILHLAAATFIGDSTVVAADDSRLRLIFYGVDGSHEKDVPIRLRPVSSMVWTGKSIVVAGGFVDETASGPLVSNVGLEIYDIEGNAVGRRIMEPPLIGDAKRNAPGTPGSRLPLVAGPMMDGRLVIAWRLRDRITFLSMSDSSSTTFSIAATPFFDQSASEATARATSSTDGSPVVFLAATDSLVAVGYFPAFGEDHHLRYHLMTSDGDVLGSDLLGPIIWGSHDGTFLTVRPRGEDEAILSGLVPKQ